MEIVFFDPVTVIVKRMGPGPDERHPRTPITPRPMYKEITATRIHDKIHRLAESPHKQLDCVVHSRLMVCHTEGVEFLDRSGGREFCDDLLHFWFAYFGTLWEKLVVVVDVH